MTSLDPARPVVDDKDWTWVLERPCPDCGFEPGSVVGSELPLLIDAAVGRWESVLLRADVALRPSPQVWSLLEYGCHVRDVFAIFNDRAALMLAEEDPLFANWDQDQTALEQRYWEQSPVTVARELRSAGERVAATFAGVNGESWLRSGRRSNGSVFTVDSLGRYFIHDVLHHLYDVSG